MSYKNANFLIVFAAFVPALAACSSPSSTAITRGSTNESTVIMDTELSPSSSIQVTKDVVYAIPMDPNEPAFHLDVYKPNESDTSPVVVFLHGSNEDKEIHEKESQALADRGVLVFTINWPTPNTDLAWKDNGKDFRMMSEVHVCAFRFARARASDYGGNPNQLTIVAFSMGARIGITAALVGDDFPAMWDNFAVKKGGPPSQVECVESDASSNVDAFVGIGGRYNSVDYLKTVDPELWNIMSPYAHIGHSPNRRIRLILGELDKNVSYELQTDFNQLLLDAGYDSTLTLWEGTHTVPIELTSDIVIEVVEK